MGQDKRQGLKKMAQAAEAKVAEGLLRWRYKKEGNLVPEGILGEDGYCFDLFEYDRDLMTYIEQRIAEAYSNVRVRQE